MNASGGAPTEAEIDPIAIEEPRTRAVLDTFRDPMLGPSLMINRLPLVTLVFATWLVGCSSADARGPEIEGGEATGNAPAPVQPNSSRWQGLPQSPGSIAVTVRADRAAEPGVYTDPSGSGSSVDGVEWTLHGPNGYTYTGHGSETLSSLGSGVYYIDLYNAWQNDYHLPAGYGFFDNHPENPDGTRNGVWTGPEQTLADGGSLSFTLDFRYRGAPPKDEQSCGLNVAPQMFWGSGFFANAMIGRSRWSGTTAELNEKGYPRRLLVAEPKAQSTNLNTQEGATGSQEFRVFWRGSGTFRIDDATNGQGTVLGPVKVTDRAGDVGIGFRYEIRRPRVGQERVRFVLRDTDPRDPIHEVEIVWRGHFDSKNQWAGTVRTVFGDPVGPPPHDHRDTRETYIVEPIKTELTDYSRILRFMSYNHFFNVEGDTGYEMHDEQRFDFMKGPEQSRPRNPGSAERLAININPRTQNETDVTRIDVNVASYVQPKSKKGRWYLQDGFTEPYAFVGRHIFLQKWTTGRNNRGKEYPYVAESSAYEITGFEDHGDWHEFEVEHRATSTPGWYSKLPVGATVGLTVTGFYNKWEGEYTSGGHMNPLHGRQYATGHGGSRRGNNAATLKQIVQSMIDMCNATDNDLYFVTPTYWGESAQLVHDFVEHVELPYKPIRTSRSEYGTDAAEYGGLKPGLKVYVEYSNEIWNPSVGDPATNYCSRWYNYYAGRSVDATGSVLPMGPRPGGAHPGFEDDSRLGYPDISLVTVGARVGKARNYQMFASWKIAKAVEDKLDAMGLLGTKYAEVFDRYRVTTADQIISSCDKMYRLHKSRDLRSFDGVNPAHEKIYAHKIAPYARYDANIVDKDPKRIAPWVTPYNEGNYDEAFRILYTGYPGINPKDFDGWAKRHPFRAADPGGSNTRTGIRSTEQEVPVYDGKPWGTYEGGAGKSLREARSLEGGADLFHIRSNEHWYQYEQQINNMMFTFEGGLDEPYIDFIYRFDSNEPWGMPHGQNYPAREFPRWRAFVDYQFLEPAPEPKPGETTRTVASKPTKKIIAIGVIVLAIAAMAMLVAMRRRMARG